MDEQSSEFEHVDDAEKLELMRFVGDFVRRVTGDGISVKLVQSSVHATLTMDPSLTTITIDRRTHGRLEVVHRLPIALITEILTGNVAFDQLKNDYQIPSDASPVLLLLRYSTQSEVDQQIAMICASTHDQQEISATLSLFRMVPTYDAIVRQQLWQDVDKPFPSESDEFVRTPARLLLRTLSRHQSPTFPTFSTMSSAASSYEPPKPDTSQRGRKDQNRRSITVTLPKPQYWKSLSPSRSAFNLETNHPALLTKPRRHGQSAKTKCTTATSFINHPLSLRGTSLAFHALSPSRGDTFSWTPSTSSREWCCQPCDVANLTDLNVAGLPLNRQRTQIGLPLNRVEDITPSKCETQIRVSEKPFFQTAPSGLKQHLMGKKIAEKRGGEETSTPGINDTRINKYISCHSIPT